VIEWDRKDALDCPGLGLRQVWDHVNAVIKLWSVTSSGPVSFSRGTLLYAAN